MEDASQSEMERIHEFYQQKIELMDGQASKQKESVGKMQS
jgi:hypothetical protein